MIRRALRKRFKQEQQRHEAELMAIANEHMQNFVAIWRKRATGPQVTFAIQYGFDARRA